MTGERWRLVTDQDGREHVSSVVLGREEASEHLTLERTLHLAAGWLVAYTGPQRFIARKGDVCRVVSVRRYGPLADTPPYRAS